MKNKLVNHLLLISNILFILGLTISIILVQKNIDINGENIIYDASLKTKLIINYIPFIVFISLSLLTAAFFYFYRKQYFVLIKNHISPRTKIFHECSIYLLFFNIAIAIIMMFSGVLMWDNKETFLFYKNIYLYIVLGTEMILTLADAAIDALSKLNIKVDLASKRMDVKN